MWTKEEYMKWLTTRGEVTEWKRMDCVAADRFIEAEALAELAIKLKDCPEPVKGYVAMMAKAHFGSSETDEFLEALDCYKHPIS